MMEGIAEQFNPDSGLLTEHFHFCGYCGSWPHQGNKEDCCYGGGIYVECPDCQEKEN